MRIPIPFWTPALLVLGLTLAAFTFLPEQREEAPVVLPAEPALYAIDKAHSSVGFRIRHLGISNVSGTFGEYDATVFLDPSDLSSIRVDATVLTASIDTGNQRRDGHLRSDDFFESERFPAMRFVSTSARDLGNNRFALSGDLTIRDVTRPVTLEGELVGTAVGPGGSNRVGLEAGTTIDRHDFGLTWDNLTEAGGVVVGRDVRIMLDIQAIEQDA